jgi:hypothetical protein
LTPDLHYSTNPEKDLQQHRAPRFTELSAIIPVITVADSENRYQRDKGSSSALHRQPNTISAKG